jgi:LemA protein
LVDAAKKYMAHEKETLMAVTQARSGLLQATQAAENNPTNANTMATLARNLFKTILVLCFIRH